MKKALILSLASILGLPILGIFTWYCISFLPHLGELEAIERQESAVLSSAPPDLYRIAVAAESKASIRIHAMRQAYWYLGCKGRPSKHLSWNLNCALWLASSYVHFSHAQVFAIWAHYAPYERGRGLAEASLYYFHKPLSDVDEQDLATLFAMVRSPWRYKPGTMITNLRTKTILEKAKQLSDRGTALTP